MHFDIIEEGQLFDNVLIPKYNLSLNDYSISNSNPKSQFVGFVIKDKSVLSSFPKNYLSNFTLPIFACENEENKLINVRLLLDTMIKYYNSESHLANQFYGNRPFFSSNFPFSSLYIVNAYYKKYGLYKEENYSETLNSCGKINWKKTINCCENIVTNDNIIYRDHYSIKEDYLENIISEAMIDVINKSYSLLYWFLDDLKPIKSKKRIRYNSLQMISILQKKLNLVFSDEKKKLIRALIDFYKMNEDGGDIYLKIYYFQDCWQKMINKYLNDYFRSASPDEIVFSDMLNRSGIHFDKKRFYVDDAHNHYIEPDHYSKEFEKHYIFDSKYYVDLIELNYKQLSYQFLLSNFFGINEDDSQCISALFLPGTKPNDLNYDIKTEFRGNMKLKTIEYYLNVSIVMISYVYNRKTF